MAVRAQAPSPCARMAVGADVSFLPQAEAQGTVFSDNAGPAEGLAILRAHGFNWVRLRLFNDPAAMGARALPNDLAYTLHEAEQARALGFRVLLDLHYSDDWADPGHQVTPRAWQGLTHGQLVNAVYAFTRDTLALFRAAGALPDMVQVGNEITAGMLWPDGRLPGNWSNLLDLLQAGIRGVHDGSLPPVQTAGPAAADARVRLAKVAAAPATPQIMIHIDKGGSRAATESFFAHLLAAQVPFDAIGQSFYPWWQGSLTELKDNLDFMARRYGKPVYVVETAYSWRPDNYVARPGKPAPGQKDPGPAPFPETPAGQRDFLAALLATVETTPGGLGAGIFWWEPAVRGPLSRRGLFDESGRALPALDVLERCGRERRR